MAPVRHRRRLTIFRALAITAPALTVACTVVAVAVDGQWPLIAAGVGVVASVVLGLAAVRLERRLNVEVAAVRAEQAAEYEQTHARYSAEHREFTSHMVGLLDAAAERLDSLRGRLNKLEEDAATNRSRADASTPSGHLTRVAEGAERDDLWPDLSDAPTVVDLVAWEDLHRDGGPVSSETPDGATGEPTERTA